MKIQHITSSAYSVNEIRKGKYQLVKVIGEYDKEEDAYTDMVKVMNNEVTEDELETKWRNNR